MEIGATTRAGARAGARLRGAFLLVACALMVALAAPPAAYAGLYDIDVYDADGNLLSGMTEIDADELMRGLTVRVDVVGNPGSGRAGGHAFETGIICDQTGEWVGIILESHVENDETVHFTTLGFSRPVMPGYTYTLKVRVRRAVDGEGFGSHSPEVAYAEFGFSVGGGTGDGSGEGDGPGDGGAPGDGESGSGEGADGEGQPADSPDGSGEGASSADPEPDSEGHAAGAASGASADAGADGEGQPADSAGGPGNGASSAKPDSEGPDRDTASESGADEGGAPEVDGADDASAPQHQATSPAQSASQPNAAQAAMQAVRRQAEAVSEGDSRTGDTLAAGESGGPAERPAASAADAQAAERPAASVAAAAADPAASAPAIDPAASAADVAAPSQPGGGTTWRLVGTSPGGSPAQNAASGLNLEVTGIPRLWLALCLLLALSAPAGAAARALLAHRRATAPSRLAL